MRPNPSANRGGKNMPDQKGVITHQRATLYQGAIPPPEMMEHFARIDATLPGRIIGMAENEGIDRRLKERAIIQKAFVVDILSTILGFLSVLGVIWLCYQFVLKGYASQAAAVACGVIVSLAVIFVLRRKPKPPAKEN